ncbi:efflux RND transporter periplasmic adaptor subunit [Brytella acorum]|uniref:Efflux RND transporter periplasmic adaptor subunit n=1 Tax=Brytella acorum TaxID=2959299 RepID=A0AA35UR12_9PROT|nr:efflux RND transporter periplasmic adaptor subunit [Brytella acorum]MDF3626122.1 efflux RND transporter periplasmic adaptor subunit [Brytella acorum]CAI9122126.1 efflux RND transporter periplasmic adaptor subunit [Brytella acorum]
MRRRSVLISGFGIVALAASGLYTIHAWQASPATIQNVPVTVTTTVARPVSWYPKLHFVGTLRAHWGTALSFQTDGLVSRINFHSGQRVEAGAILAQLQLNDEPGLFAKYTAQADLDLINLNRDTAQFEAHAVSRAIVDHDRLTLAADRAQRDAEEALIAMKSLKAPFSGRLGIRRVDPGQYLKAGTEVVTLQAIDPIYADFFVPQRFSEFVHVGAIVTVSIDSASGHVFQGRVTATTPAIDAASRTLMVRATLPNADERLLPGGFASVDLAYEGPRSLIVIPQAALIYHPYGNTVFVVTYDQPGRGVVRERLVVTGEARGDLIVIASGLRAGEAIVSAGQMKLRDKAVVMTSDVGQPGEDAAPSVPEE